MSEDELIDLYWNRAEKYSQRVALTHEKVEWLKLRNYIFEYFRTRDMGQIFTDTPDKNLLNYCHKCMAHRPTWHFC